MNWSHGFVTCGTRCGRNGKLGGLEFNVRGKVKEGFSFEFGKSMGSGCEWVVERFSFEGGGM